MFIPEFPRAQLKLLLRAKWSVVPGQEISVGCYLEGKCISLWMSHRETWRTRIKPWEQSFPNATWHKAQQRISWQVGGGGGKTPQPVCLSRSTQAMQHEARREKRCKPGKCVLHKPVLPKAHCVHSWAPLAQDKRHPEKHSLVCSSFCHAQVRDCLKRIRAGSKSCCLSGNAGTDSALT